MSHLIDIMRWQRNQKGRDVNLDITSSDTTRLLAPSYWLVAALDWPVGRDVAEAAWAIAPGLISRDGVTADAHQILGCADLYADAHSTRTVFFSDLTRLCTETGTSWANLGIDWQAALNELHAGPYPELMLTVTERAYLLICDSSTEPAEPSHPWTGHERELLREVITDELTAAWPAYIHSLIQAGRLHSS
jgi:hypothetical protein